MLRLCFVCLGNICRSPTAEGVMQALIEEEELTQFVEVDSAGTAAYHSGERADRRARQTARDRGIDLTSLARKFEASDFERFDYVLAMDTENYENLLALAPDEGAKERLYLLREFDPDSPSGASVPDPYYGGPQGFEEVFDICDAACRGLLVQIRQSQQLPE